MIEVEHEIESGQYMKGRDLTSFAPAVDMKVREFFRKRFEKLYNLDHNYLKYFSQIQNKSFTHGKNS